jgi:hypothetical protein
MKRGIALEYRNDPTASIEDCFRRALAVYLHRNHSITGITHHTAEKLELPQVSDRHTAPFVSTISETWREDIDAVILKRLQKGANRTIAKILKSKRVVVFELGEHVRVRPFNYSRRPKGEGMWKWEARILARTKNHKYTLQWITQGPTTAETPGSISSEKWPTRHLKRIPGSRTPSEMLGEIFFTPQKADREEDLGGKEDLQEVKRTQEMRRTQKVRRTRMRTRMRIHREAKRTQTRIHREMKRTQEVKRTQARKIWETRRNQAKKIYLVKRLYWKARREVRLHQKGRGTHREARRLHREARRTHRKARRLHWEVRRTYREVRRTHREARRTHRKARRLH